MPLEPVQFYADLEYSDGSVREGVSAEWSSSDPIAVFVSSNGLVTGRKHGVFDRGPPRRARRGRRRFMARSTLIPCASADALARSSVSFAAIER